MDLSAKHGQITTVVSGVQTDNIVIRNPQQDGDIVFAVNDGGTDSTVITINGDNKQVDFSGNVAISGNIDITALTSNEAELEENIVANDDITNADAAQLILDPSYEVDDAGTTTITNHNYIQLQDVTLTETDGTLNLTNACVFQLDAVLGTHNATTNLDKSANTASGTLKINVDGTIYHVQLYADS